jgi:hypothetical protein
MRKTIGFLLLLIVLLGASLAYADTNDGVNLPDTQLSIGDFANNLMGPVEVLTKMFEDIAIVAGVGFLFAALIQYKAHRENPSQVRLGKPISYLVFGVILILFPLVGYLVSYHPAMVSF